MMLLLLAGNHFLAFVLREGGLKMTKTKHFVCGAELKAEEKKQKEVLMNLMIGV